MATADLQTWEDLEGAMLLRKYRHRWMEFRRGPDHRFYTYCGIKDVGVEPLWFSKEQCPDCASLTEPVASVPARPPWDWTNS